MSCVRLKPRQNPASDFVRLQPQPWNTLELCEVAWRLEYRWSLAMSYLSGDDTTVSISLKVCCWLSAWDSSEPERPRRDEEVLQKQRKRKPASQSPASQNTWEKLVEKRSILKHANMPCPYPSPNIDIWYHDVWQYMSYIKHMCEVSDVATARSCLRLFVFELFDKALDSICT